MKNPVKSLFFSIFSLLPYEVYIFSTNSVLLVTLLFFIVKVTLDRFFNRPCSLLLLQKHDKRKEYASITGRILYVCHHSNYLLFSIC